MLMVFNELKGLTALVDKVVFMPDMDAPVDRPYPFVYYITIDNQSDLKVVIQGRKWVVTDVKGIVQVIEGDGVVGETPILNPGDHFSYNSYMTIAHDSVAEGCFFGVANSGLRVRTRVAPFELNVH